MICPNAGESISRRRFRLRANLHVSTTTVEVSLVETELRVGLVPTVDDGANRYRHDSSS
jgi:hypothetical protein